MAIVTIALSIAMIIWAYLLGRRDERRQWESDRLRERNEAEGADAR